MAESNSVMTSVSKYDHIKNKIAEEIKDAKDYLKMLEIAVKNEDEYLIKYLKEIIKDEYSHAKFMYEYLCKMKIELTETERQNYYILIKEIENFPRT